ncbi:MAG: hypothetical protein QOI92_2361 [Chloroflexota bacterium]|nr:hypothetical protein [Chloroflexota bacterium]
MGWALVAIGLGLVVLVRIRDPWPAPPLYDGVVVIAPYVWLDPPPGELGGALGTSDKIVVSGGQNRIVAVATGEEPPQAQILATPGALVLSTGATSLTVSITPIEPVQPVSDGYIDGNVYRFVVVDQLGRPATAPASAYVSIFLRPANPADADGTIERFDGSSWVPIESSSEGGAGFLAIVTSFGDFAVVGTGPSPFATTTPAISEPPPSQTPEATAPESTVVEAPTPASSVVPLAPSDALSMPILAIGVGIAALVVFGALVLLLRRRRRRERDD